MVLSSHPFAVFCVCVVTVASAAAFQVQKPPFVVTRSNQIFRAATVAQVLEAPPDTATTKPGEEENALFQCDASVDFWRRFETESNQDNLRRIQELLTKTFRTDDPSLRTYWASHVLRTGYFTMNAAISSIAADWNRRLTNPESSQAAFQPSNLLRGGLATRLLLETMHVYEQDYAMIEKGILKAPWDAAIRLDQEKRPTVQWSHRQLNPLFALQETARTVQESIEIMGRRNQGKPKTIQVDGVDRDLYPEYYLNDFHYQTDGWMSSASAQKYEASTEMLFLGRQDAMHRQTLIPVRQHFASQSPQSILEVGAGTGRFSTFTRDLFPTASMTVSDLSPFYLDKARDNDQYWRSYRGAEAMKEATERYYEPQPAQFVQANAEALPFPDESFDVVTCVYLFHELPEEARAQAALEMARVVKSGGMVVVTDSLQLGDRPANDPYLGNFSNMNEPHYKNYIACDLKSLFEGLDCDQKYMASNTKTLSFVKPEGP